MQKQKIEEYIKSLGLDTMGMIPMRRLTELEPFLAMRQDKKLQNEFEEKEIEKRVNPALLMEDGKTIISIAFPYYHEGDMNPNGFSVYTRRADYHKVVREYLDQVCQFIESLGGKAEGFVDSNALPERYLAYLAGVGFIGRNNMIITKKYGSYVFLGEIITDLELPCEDQRTFAEIKEFKECGDCRLCYQKCPSKSIQSGKVNPNICLSYLTQKKELEDKEIRLLKENVFGCDYCQLGCPYNQKSMKNVLKQFETLDCMNEDVSVYAGMDNQHFKAKIAGTSCGWRGKNVIRRNAIINLAQRGEEVDMYKGESPYINQYIERVQTLFGPKENEEED